jgi:hypothetical protein
MIDNFENANGENRCGDIVGGTCVDRANPSVETGRPCAFGRASDCGDDEDCALKDLSPFDGSLGATRFASTATTLSNGMVLVAGGFSRADAANPELYAAVIQALIYVP